MVKKEKKQKTISYRSQFNDTAIFMASSLSNFVNNLAEGINKIKLNENTDTMISNVTHVESKTKTVN